MIQTKYIQFLTSLHTEFYTSLSSIGSAIQILAGLLAMLYIGNKVWASYAKNEPLDLWVLAKPFVIAFFCVQFNLVIEILEGTLSPLQKFGKSVVLQGESKLNTISTIKQNAIKSKQAQEKKELASMTSKYSPYMPNDPTLHSVSAMANATQVILDNDLWLDGLLWIVKQIALLIMNVSVITLLASRAISLTLLYVLGPLALVVSLIPGWQTAFLSWVGKYASIWLWLPFFYLIQGVIHYINATLMEYVNVDILTNKSVFAGGSLALDTLGLIIDITLAVSVINIPKMVAWIIPEGATSSIGNRAATGMLGGLGAVAGNLGVKSVFAGVRSFIPMHSSRADTTNRGKGIYTNFKTAHREIFIMNDKALKNITFPKDYQGQIKIINMKTGDRYTAEVDNRKIIQQQGLISLNSNPLLSNLRKQTKKEKNNVF